MDVSGERQPHSSRGCQVREQRMLCGGLLCCITVVQMAESVSKMEVNLGKSEVCRVSVVCMPG